MVKEQPICRLFQKRVVRNKFDIYVYMNTYEIFQLNNYFQFDLDCIRSQMSTKT